MTQAQILRAQVMYNFLCRLANPYDAYNDKELMDLFRCAQEEQNGKKIKAIREEMSRRNREV